jgi:hypothetical protein
VLEYNNPQQQQNPCERQHYCPVLSNVPLQRDLLPWIATGYLVSFVSYGR